MQDNRLRILQAAAHVYAQHGYRGATTRRIAEEAGVNEITVFRHFGNKSALLASAVQECGMLRSRPAAARRARTIRRARAHGLDSGPHGPHPRQPASHRAGS